MKHSRFKLVSSLTPSANDYGFHWAISPLESGEIQQMKNKVPSETGRGASRKKTNSNTDARWKTVARSYTEEADYYEFDILPWIHYGDIYRARLKHSIGKLRDEARRLERRR